MKRILGSIMKNNYLSYKNTNIQAFILCLSKNILQLLQFND